MILMMTIQLVDEGELDDGDSVSSGYVDVLTIIKLSTFQFFFSFCLSKEVVLHLFLLFRTVKAAMITPVPPLCSLTFFYCRSSEPPSGHRRELHRQQRR